MSQLKSRGRGSLSVVALILAGIGGLVALGGSGGCVPAYEARLRALRDRGDLARADRLLAAAETRRPEDPAIVRERGILAFERGDPEEAIRLLERALGLAPEDARAALYIAAASERTGRWDEAGARYLRAEQLQALPPALAVELTCHRLAVEDRGLAARVETRLAAERSAARAEPGQRILFLPLATNGSGEVALSLRLGLASLLAADWERAGTIEPVSFREVLAFLEALQAPIDAPIEPELRDRLALLTGARYVVEGQLSELNDVVSVAPVLIDRGTEGGPRVERVEYLTSRVGTLLDLEKRLLFRLTPLLGMTLTPAQEDALGLFAAQSGLAVVLYGEALRLHRAGDDDAATERLGRAAGLDPGFRAAREARLALTRCQGAAGEPDRLLRAHEAARRGEDERALERALLAETNRETGRVGGPEGEGENLSLNRPLGSGTVTIPLRLPR